MYIKLDVNGLYKYLVDVIIIIEKNPGIDGLFGSITFYTAIFIVTIKRLTLWKTFMKSISLTSFLCIVSFMEFCLSQRMCVGIAF